MKEYIRFPYDPDTLGVIKEMEEYLSLPHKNINEMSNLKLKEYINQLTLLLIQTSKLDS